MDKKFFYAILTAVNFGDVMKLPGKLIFIKEAILTDIRNGVLKADEKIPSRSACMERFHCARATIDRAIADLERSGVLYSRHGSGTFVSPVKRELPEVTRLFVVWKLEIGNRFLPGSPEAILREHFPVTLVDRDKLPLFLERMAMPGSAVLWKYPRYMEMTAMQFLDRAGIPQILMGRDYEPYNFITIDANSGLAKGVDFLTSGGETKLGIIHSPAEIERNFIAERQLIFYRLLLQRNLQLPPEFVASASRNSKEYPAELAHAAEKLLSGDSHCHAIYMECSLWYEHFIRAAAALGKFPGRDFKLLVYDPPDVDVLPEGVMVIKQDYGKVSAIIKRWLDNRGRGKIHLRLAPVLQMH